MKYGKTKKVVSAVVRAGVSDIIWNVAKSAMPADTSKIRKVCIYLGAFALGGMVGDKAGEYAEKWVEDTANTIVDFAKEEIEYGRQ